MSNLYESRILNLNLAITYGEATVTFLTLAKSAPLLQRIPLLLTAITNYALHLVFVKAAQQGDPGIFCTLERTLGFQILPLSEPPTAQIVTSVDVMNPSFISGFNVADILRSGRILVQYNGQWAFLSSSHLVLLNFPQNCVNEIRNLPDANIPASPSISNPIGCFEVAAQANVRTHPGPGGKVLGGVDPNLHQGVYYYYGVQGDTDSTVNCDINNNNCVVSDLWYQIAPLGYGKEGYAMWVRGNSNGLERLTTTELGSCPPNPVIFQEVLGLPVSTDAEVTITLHQGLFGGFTSDEQILTFILAVESGYDLQAARDIAYVFRSRMMSDKFPNTVFGVMRHVAAWSSWGMDYLPGTQIQAKDFRQGLTSTQLLEVQKIESEVVPSLLRLPGGGLGVLGFSPSNPSIEYALYTLGDQLYSAGEAADYIDPNILFRLTPETTLQRLLASGTFTSCLSFPQLRALYIEHTMVRDQTNNVGFVTLFFSDHPGCIN